MPKLTSDQRAALKAAHPDAFILRSSALPGHDFVFRPARVAEFDAFLSAVNGGETTAKVYAHRTLALDLVVFPAREELQALAAEKPGVVHTLGDELAVRAGLKAEVQVEGL